jgi:hypothetical protein
MIPNMKNSDPLIHINPTSKAAQIDCSASFSNAMMEGPGADSEEKREPVSDVDTDQWMA